MPSIAAIKMRAKATIDAEAGAARLRYITDVPGQQAVYMRKAEQAAAYAAAHALDPQAPVPPYIAAEAEAMDQAPIDVAQLVLQLAALWEDQLSPAIEAARLAGKAAVDAAPDEAAVAAARDAAVTTLTQL